MTWNEHGLTRLLTDILRHAAAMQAQEHFGAPYMTPYQLAIEVQCQAPEVFLAIGKPLGGLGAGQTNTLDQYLANELSKRVKRDGDRFPIEGAALSSEHVEAVIFHNADGAEVESTIPGSGYPFSMFRWRADFASGDDQREGLSS
jgi:hypothetical protein